MSAIKAPTHLQQSGGSLVQRYGPWAMVTGASDGIGLEIARVLAERGFKLLLVARRGDLLGKICIELHDRHGGECIAIEADLCTSTGNERVREVLESHEVGLFIAAAGRGTSGLFANNPLEQELGMLFLNCAAVLQGVHHAVAQMRKRGTGAVVLFSSVVAFHGVARSAQYAATKAWVQTFGEGLQLELKPQGIEVLISAPGPVHTGFAHHANMQMPQALSPRLVALRTVNAIGKTGFIRPGWLSKGLGWSLATLPRFIRVKVMSQIMKGMVRHEKPSGV
jgi:short-subunit dehydrogenase